MNTIIAKKLTNNVDRDLEFLDEIMKMLPQTELLDELTKKFPLSEVYEILEILDLIDKNEIDQAISILSENININDDVYIDV